MASANPDKVGEIARALATLLPEVIVHPRPMWVPDVVEDADSLLGNAELKARALCMATGLPAVADDTGLFVNALYGRPGVYSARYAGQNATYADNCAKLLAELGGVPTGERGASFRTVALVAWPDGTHTWAEGIVEGEISKSARGSTGFGYDPLFIPHTLDDRDSLAPNDRTFAELGIDVKNRISHRSRAFASLALMLAARS